VVAWCVYSASLPRATHGERCVRVRFVTFRPGEPNASRRRFLQEMFSAGRYWFARVPGGVADDQDMFPLHELGGLSEAWWEVLNRYGCGG